MLMNRRARAMSTSGAVFGQTRKRMSAFGQKNNPSPRSPHSPLTGRDIMMRLRKLLADEHGYGMTLERLAAMIGRPKSTAAYFLNVSDQPHVLAFVRLLERLSEIEQYRFLKLICRTFPTVLHRQIAHCPRAVCDLLRLLTTTRGLTVVRGPEAARTFIVAALGHTFPQIDTRHRTAGGLDLLPSDRIVPVETLITIKPSHNKDQIRKAVIDVWSKIKSSPPPLLLLNGVWSACPEVRDELLALAIERHVVIADEQTPDPRLARKAGIAPAHTITARETHDCPARIHFTLETM